MPPPGRLERALGLTLPLLQAGMGGVAGPRLCAAVSREGAGGILALYKEAPDRVRQLVADTARATTRPFGVNLIPELFADPGTCRAQLAAALEVLPTNAFVSFYGLPGADLTDAACAHPVVVEVGTGRDADRALDLGADVLVLQGTEAGGHLLGDSRAPSLLAAARARHPEAVLATAGGIANGSDLADAVAAGADGAMAGTAFVCALESEAHPLFRRRVLAARAHDTVVTAVFDIGWPHRRHRVLRNTLTEDPRRRPATFIASTTLGDRRMPIPRYSAAVPTAHTTGRVEEMAMYCGRSCARVTGTEPAADLLTRIRTEYAARVEATRAHTTQERRGDDVDDLRKPIVEWLHARRPGLDTIPPNLDLIENRLVDSLGFMEFILLLEDLIGRELDLDKLSVDQFRTLDAIAENFLGPAERAR